MLTRLPFLIVAAHACCGMQAWREYERLHGAAAARPVMNTSLSEDEEEGEREFQLLVTTTLRGWR